MAGQLAARPAVEVVDKAPTLDELAATIRLEHEACMGVAQRTLEHATRAGEALLAVRERTMRTGTWTTWVRESAPLSRAQCYTYMRIAAFREFLPDGVGIKEGEMLLAGLPALGTGRGRPRLPDSMKQDAERMRGEGVPYKQIAKRLGISPSTVHNWFNGTHRKHQREAAKALREKRQQRAIKQAVTKTGGALAEAYSMAERMDDVLGQAHREATEPEARRELAKAHEFQRAMRDAIVRGLGVE